MAEESSGTIATLDQLEAQQLQELRGRIEQERQARRTQARGQAISRGLGGSSFETRAMAEIDRAADTALQQGELQIRSHFSDQKIGLEEAERGRQWQALEEEKQRAFQSGETEKAQKFAEQQAQIQRDAEAMASRRENRASLVNTGAQIGTMALLSKGALFGGGDAAAKGPGVMSSALNRTGNALFGSGANPATGAAGPSLPTFGQGFMTPLSRGVVPGGAGAVGQATGFAASTAGGAYLGQRVGDSLFGQRYNNDRAVSRGGKAGSLIGAGIGSYLGGPMGGAIGGAFGGAIGSNTGEGLRLVSSAGSGASDNKGITLGNLATGAARKPLEAIGGVLAGGAGVKAVQKVKKLFCFVPETLIEMADGSQKSIGKVQVGEITKGGKVERVSYAKADDMYSYRGVRVSGGHAVHEDYREWKRIKDSENSHRVEGTFDVVNLVTTKHRIYVGVIEFADEYENDNYENLSLDQSLAALNSQREVEANGAASI